MGNTLAKTVDSTVPVEADANQVKTDVKTVDSTEPMAEAVSESNDDAKTNDPAKAEDKDTEAKGDKSGDAKTEDKNTGGDSDKAEDKDTEDKDADNAGDDDLDDGELEALDAKVRRRVNKVQRENVNLRGRLKDAEGAHEAAKRENERLTVALNAGLGGDMLKFLTGDTVEELEKNAADLLAVIGYNGRVTPSNGPVERGTNPRRGGIDPTSAAANETNLDNIGARIYKR